MKKITKSTWSVCQLFFMLLSGITGNAQDPHPAYRHYTVEDGLPSSEVYQVKQDSKGYIWFATGNGVSRFNGYEFENFSIDDGLPDNTVFEIYEDQFERIWFVPLSCKLSYYYKGKIYPFQYNDQLQKMLLNTVKTSFCVDSNGTIFLGLHAQGVIEITKDGKISDHFFPYKERELSIMEPVPHTYIYSYYCQPFPLRSIHFQSQQYERSMRISLDMGKPIGASGRVIESKYNKCLIGIGNSLYRMDKKDMHQITCENFPSRIVSLYEDKDSDLWVGTIPAGLYYLKKGDFNTKKLYLNEFCITGIIQDSEGGYWYTTEGSGVFYAPSKEVSVFNKDEEAISERALCLTTDKEKVFVGYQNGFIDEVKDEKKIKSHDFNAGSIHSNEISAVYYDYHQKQVFIAGKMQSGRLKNGKFLRSKVEPVFNDMVADSAGIYWEACSGGFSKRDQKDNITNIAGLQKFKNFRRLNAITEANNNILLLGAINGLWRYDKTLDLYSYIGYKHPLIQNRILDLTIFSDSLMVIATKGAGLVLYDYHNGIQINTRNGLCGNNVYAVCVDSSNIWVATDNGLNKVTITQRIPLKYKIYGYTTTDGLPSNEINDVIKVKGKVWLATNKGLASFYPWGIENKSVQLPVYIDKIQINEKDTGYLTKYNLAFNQNNIKVSFTGLGYKNAGKLRYRYKMLGLDTNWIYTTTREVQFTTLPANSYTFVLNVLNTEGSWSTNVVKVHFNISLPFWKEWWFILPMVLIGIYILFLLFKYRLKRVQSRQEKIEELNKNLISLKLKALRAQMNPHFTFNVMNSIQHFIASNDGEAANRYLSRFSRLIRLILGNSEKNLVPLADEIKALELYLELESMRFEERFEYSITVDKSIDIMEVEIPSMLIQPYVENSIKHGILNLNKRGIIKIEIQKQDNFLKCIVEDNGVGRSQSYFINKKGFHKSFGTSITQERLATINALYKSQLSESVVDLQDEQGNATGTRVEIYIPFN